MNDHRNQPHPEDLLEAYTLDALEESETLQVESHLEGCGQCRLAVAQLLNTVSLLGQSVVQQQPHPALRLRVVRALESPAVQTESRVSRPIWRLYKTPVVRFLLPTAAAIMVALFSLAVAMNMGLSNRTDDLERENSTLTAQMAVSAEQDFRMAETVQELRAANYWLADPDNQSMNLTPPDGSGSSRGILVVANDGSKAMLLLAGMGESSPSSTYHVWLMRGADKVWVGELQADEEGWGTVTIQPDESVYRFDKVELTEEIAPGGESRVSNMVLEGSIAAPGPSRMYTVQQPRWR